MTWTVTREEYEEVPRVFKSLDEAEVFMKYGDPPQTITNHGRQRAISPKLHVRAIIDIDNEQAEIKELIASLQKHVKEETA